MTYVATPLHKTPALEVMKVTIMVDSTLVINTIYLVSMDHALH